MPRRAKKSKRAKSRARLFIGLTAIIALAAAAMAISYGGCGSSSKGRPPEVSGRPAATNNVKGSLEAFRGKVVILDFWATWCGPCRTEIPGFVDLQTRYRDQGLEVIGISIDPMTPPRGSAEAVAPFMKSYGINYTILMVESPAAMSGYDVSRGIPTTYVLDREGRVVKTYVGARPKEVFERDIKELL